MKDLIPKILRILLSAIMVVFAYLQLNDPDALRWGLVYGVVAGLGVFGTVHQNYVRYAISIGYVALALWLFPDVYHGVGQMRVERPEIEQARESLGVLIAAGINAINAWLYYVESRTIE